MIGIILGTLILKYYSVNKLHWIYTKEKKSESALLECSAPYRAIKKLQPQFLIKHDWQVFRSLKRFYGVMAYCMISLAIDLNNFFLKTVLNIPAAHHILKFRLLLWCPLVLAASEEYFEYITNIYSKRVRPFMWMTVLLLCVESGIVIRNYGVYTGTPFPTYIKAIWTIIGIIFVSTTVWIAYRGKDDKEEEWNPYDPKLDIKEVN